MMDINKFSIKECDENDIKSIHKLSVSSLQNSWSFESFIEDFKNIFSKYFSLVYEKKLIGFISFWEIMNEIDITNIVISENFRGYGLSKILLSHLINSHKGFEFFLEVRESNFIAINLYKTFKFLEICKRENYYKNPTENAIIMKKF